MTTELPAYASVVVIGGGVMGCSTLYHLADAGRLPSVPARPGWKRSAISGAVGPRWHAAGARPAGACAQTSMRIEKRFLSYGHDLDTDISPPDAGLGFAVAWSTDFIGRDALSRRRDEGRGNRIVSIVLDDAGAVPLGGEPVRLVGQIAGRTTSAAFGHRVGRPVALADLSLPAAREDGARVAVEIAGRRDLFGTARRAGVAS